MENAKDRGHQHRHNAGLRELPPDAAQALRGVRLVVRPAAAQQEASTALF